MLSFSSTIPATALLSFSLLTASITASSTSNLLTPAIHHHEQRSSRLHHDDTGVSRKRSHIKMAKRKNTSRDRQMSKVKKDLSVLLTKTGDGTFYYDVNGAGTCGAANGITSYPETTGYSECEPDSGAQTLLQRGSNYVVAIPSNMLTGSGLTDYCGKQVSATWNGKTVSNLIIWDGCEACNDNGGLDFSSSAFAQLFGDTNCPAGRMTGMTWEIMDKQVWEYPSGTLVSGSGSGSSSGDDGGASSKSSPSSSASSSWQAPSSTSSSSYWTSSSSPSSWSDESQTHTSSAIAADKNVPAATKSVLNLLVEDNVSSSSSPSSDTTQTSTIAPSSTSTSTFSQQDTASVDNSISSDSATDNVAAPSPASSSSYSSSASDSSNVDGAACPSSPGAWQCSGNTLQQCTQTKTGWIWSTRVKCAVAPINCTTDNPVCPEPIARRRR